MVNYPRWAIAFTLIICVWGIVFASSNFLRESSQFLPDSKVRLGLDLQGGAHLLLEVEVDEVVKATLESIESLARRELRRRKPRIKYTGGIRTEGNTVVIRGINPGDLETALERLNAIDRDLVDRKSVV